MRSLTQVVTKHRSFMSLIYALFIAMPMLSIFARVVYVQANKNAYQSYSGEPLEYETTQLTSVNDMDVYETYMFTNVGSYSSNVDTNYIGYTDISNIETNNLALKTSLETGYYFRFTYASNNKTVYVYDDTLAVIRSEVMNQQTITFNFVLTSYQINSLTNVSMFYTFEEINNSYLDNVFEYSVSSFIKDNNFGRVDFFEWFVDLFLDSNSVNSLYINFANWYMNYMLLVSCAYLLFLVLMWFFSFSRKLLERGMNYDW